MPASRLQGMIERYSADRALLNRYDAVPNSDARSARRKEFLTEWRTALDKMDFDKLGLDDRVDYLLFRNHLDHELRGLRLAAQKRAETAPLLPFAQVIVDLEEARHNMTRPDPAQSAGCLTALTKQIEATRKAVEAGLKPDSKEGLRGFKKTVANRAAGTADNLRGSLRAWYEFYSGYDPQFTWWTAEPFKAADSALQSYATFLREQLVGIKPGDKTTIIGDPIGHDALLSELAYEMIPYTPEELVAIANREFAWCEAEMKKASQAMGFGDDWKKALEKVKQDYVEPGAQPDLIRDYAQEAIAFVDAHDLVTVPPLARTAWRMEMMSPDQQLASPFFLGGENIIVSFPTNSMTHEQKMMSLRGNNKHFARATVHHELIPGHKLQAYMEERYRTYRGPFNTPFWTEGWALYFEMLFWDLNFPKTPENRVGMLFWRMHRCARIIFSLNFHLEKMTPQECVDFLVDRVGHERDNAAAEVRRSVSGAYGPLYQCAYMIGGIQFRALHRELVASGKMTDRAFHDAILHENNIPVEMVRALLTKQKPSKDFISNWKFDAVSHP